MQIQLVLLILISVFLSSGSQVLLKFGMTAPTIRGVLANASEPLQIAIAILSSPSVMLGLTCFALSAVVWLFVLSKIQLSTAYPFVALGVAVTVVAGRLLFDEPISIPKLLGVMLIIAGVSTVAVSA
jgi:multidrug transporter EmrE-like cation transporter